MKDKESCYERCRKPWSVPYYSGFDTLPQATQKELLNDPANLQPMLAPANCSKNCTTEWVDGGWKQWGEDKISPAYKEELKRQQMEFAQKVEETIKQYQKGKL